MQHRTTIALLAGALTLMGFPAFAQDLPDSGSKNFTPPSDTPSYFNKETAPVSARTDDTTEKDWSAVDALAPHRAARHRVHSIRRFAGRHGRYAVLHPSAKHAGSKALGTTHARSAPATTAKHGRFSSGRASAAGKHRGA
ncbi:MAG: hypothetical protein J2P48_17635 [Alphaproteobacteria bacterium]|nr:hypothetical protein [Alphaproteobacteria bacterium]